MVLLYLSLCCCIAVAVAPHVHIEGRRMPSVTIHAYVCTMTLEICESCSCCRAGACVRVHSVVILLAIDTTSTFHGKRHN
jgi:hypothetical protein